MGTHKEKAKELVVKFEFYTYSDFKDDRGLADAIQCALICVDEIMEFLEGERGFNYWQEVKTEIEKL